MWLIIVLLGYCNCTVGIILFFPKHMNVDCSLSVVIVVRVLIGLALT